MKYRPLYVRELTGGPGGSGYTRVELPDGNSGPSRVKSVSDELPAADGARVFAGDNLRAVDGAENGEGAASWFESGSTDVTTTPD